jgi:hypothetical protein
MYLGAAGRAHCEFIYWSDFDGGDIRRANLDGTGQIKLVRGQSMPIGPTLDLTAGHIYWGNVGGNSIRRANLDGSDRKDIVKGLSGVGAPAVDLAAGKMYFNNLNAGTIERRCTRFPSRRRL